MSLFEFEGLFLFLFSSSPFWNGFHFLTVKNYVSFCLFVCNLNADFDFHITT